MAQGDGPRQLQLKLRDGRSLEVLMEGPAKGLPLIFHLGTPSAAVLFRPLVAEARRHRLRTVVYSRPGYASSTAKHGRSVADAVADVQSILDELDADGIPRHWLVGRGSA